MSETRPWLSILLPIYNVRPYLEACVASLLAQVDDGVELLLLDDCSTDGTDELMRDLASRHPGRLTLLFHAQNGGVSAARNSLLDAARGDWLWFVDPDDFLEPGAMLSLRQALQVSDVDLVLCDFRDVRAKPKLKHRFRNEHHKRTHIMAPRQPCRDSSLILEGMFRQGHLHLWTKVARRELWDGLRFPVGHCFEDVAVLPALLQRARCAYYIPEVWIGYRKRPGSILATGSAAKTDDMQDSLNGLPALLDAGPRPANEAARLAAGFFVAKMYIAAMRYAQQHADQPRLAHYTSQLERNLPCSVAQLLADWRRRGWWWRAIRLTHWIRVGRRAQAGLASAKPSAGTS